tara:strand:+ start:1037 stop:1681 length:645 start_codon:yes stop_codon:yes gene_type:complete
MGFQVGTPVDPRLLDYSGYAQGITNAASIQAAALADLGAKIGDAVSKHKTKELEKEQKNKAIEGIGSLLKNNPEFAMSQGLVKEMIDTGRTNIVTNQPEMEFKYDDGAIKVASTTIVDTLGIQPSQALVGASLLQTIKGKEKPKPAQGIKSYADFVDAVSLDDNYEIKKGKLFTRNNKGKMVPAQRGDVIFGLTPSPLAFENFFLRDPEGLYQD